MTRAEIQERIYRLMVRLGGLEPAARERAREAAEFLARKAEGSGASRK